MPELLYLPHAEDPWAVRLFLPSHARCAGRYPGPENDTNRQARLFPLTKNRSESAAANA